MKMTQKLWNGLLKEDSWAWLEMNAKLLEKRCLSEIDRINLVAYLIEEKEISQDRIVGKLVPLIAHLLKIKHWKSDATDGTRIDWRKQIRGFRAQCDANFTQELKGPDAKKVSNKERYAREEGFAAAYKKARTWVTQDYKEEHGLDISIPVRPEFGFYEAMDADFYNGDETPPKSSPKKGRKK